MQLKRDGQEMKSRKEKKLLFINCMKKVSEHPTMKAKFPNLRTVLVILIGANQAEQGCISVVMFQMNYLQSNVQLN